MSGQPSYLGVVTARWVAALKSSDSLERRLAAHALAEIGRMAREAVPPLTEALRDTESFVRVWAAAALARVEPEHPDVIPALVAGTRDGISFVRSHQQFASSLVRIAFAAEMTKSWPVFFARARTQARL